MRRSCHDLPPALIGLVRTTSATRSSETRPGSFFWLMLDCGVVQESIMSQKYLIWKGKGRLWWLNFARMIAIVPRKDDLSSDPRNRRFPPGTAVQFPTTDAQGSRTRGKGVLATRRALCLDLTTGVRGPAFRERPGLPSTSGPVHPDVVHVRGLHSGRPG